MSILTPQSNSRKVFYNLRKKKFARFANSKKISPLFDKDLRKINPEFWLKFRQNAQLFV